MGDSAAVAHFNAKPSPFGVAEKVVEIRGQGCAAGDVDAFWNARASMIRARIDESPWLEMPESAQLGLLTIRVGSTPSADHAATMAKAGVLHSNRLVLS